MSTHENVRNARGLDASGGDGLAAAEAELPLSEREAAHKKIAPLTLAAIAREFTVRIVLVVLTLLAGIGWWWLSWDGEQPGGNRGAIRLFEHGK